MIVREVKAKSILSKSKIFEFTVNPYTGCAHACAYCYARFMQKYHPHPEPWGEFVDVKINAPELLLKAVSKTPPGKVWVSSVCDCYQPVERKYELTKRCLEILVQHGWPVNILTKSSLVLRDIGLLKEGKGIEVGFSITTGDEAIRKLFEPGASQIQERIDALETLHKTGIKTFAMIAPLLPGADDLPERLAGKVDYVLIDRLNYHHADHVFKKHGLGTCLTEGWFYERRRELLQRFDKLGVEGRGTS